MGNDTSILCLCHQAAPRVKRRKDRSESQDSQSSQDSAETMPISQTQGAAATATQQQPVHCSWKPTSKMQAVCVITLAKMCLQNEEMAKKIIPAYGRLLDTTKDDAIKNNIMLALTDMCVRFASLVDPLLPQMTACLKEK